jgi:hypothetical protein
MDMALDKWAGNLQDKGEIRRWPRKNMPADHIPPSNIRAPGDLINVSPKTF